MGQVFKPKFFYEYINDNGDIIMDEPFYKNLNKNITNNFSNIPSRVIYYYDYNGDKIITTIEYITNGKYHREHGPARLFLYDNGAIKEEHFYKNGEFYAEDKLTIIKYYKNGKVRSYCRQLKKNNINVISFKKDGSIEKECWYLDSKLHREDGPAMINYYNYWKKDTSSSKPCEQYWYKLGKLHRLYEPAVTYESFGKTIHAFYLNGIKYSDQFQHMILSSEFEEKMKKEKGSN